MFIWEFAMKNLRIEYVVIFFVTFFLCYGIALGNQKSIKNLKIGVVDLNRALNESEEGIRSKSMLEAEGRKKQEEFKQEEEELRTLINDLQNNLLLTEEAKAEKEEEIKLRESELRQKGRAFQNELRNKERMLTESIFKELKASIRTISIRENYDMVLEKTASEIILYMKPESVDITQKVIDHFNSLKQGKTK